MLAANHKKISQSMTPPQPPTICGNANVGGDKHTGEGGEKTSKREKDPDRNAPDVFNT